MTEEIKGMIKDLTFAIIIIHNSTFIIILPPALDKKALRK